MHILQNIPGLPENHDYKKIVQKNLMLRWTFNFLVRLVTKADVAFAFGKEKPKYDRACSVFTKPALNFS